MNLSEIVPLEQAEERVGEDIVVSSYGFAEIDNICELKRQTMCEIGLAIGYRMKLEDPSFDLGQFAEAFESNDPKLYEQFEPFLGQPSLANIVYVHAELADETAHYRTVAELLVAQVYPSILHIGDVELSNPRRPIPVGQRIREFTHFKGLGLLPTVVHNCVQYCHEHGLAAVCLTPAALDLVPTFEAVGFQRDQNPLAELMREAGAPGPMSLRIEN